MSKKKHNPISRQEGVVFNEGSQQQADSAIDRILNSARRFFKKYFKRPSNKLKVSKRRNLVKKAKKKSRFRIGKKNRKEKNTMRSKKSVLKSAEIVEKRAIHENNAPKDHYDLGSDSGGEICSSGFDSWSDSSVSDSSSETGSEKTSVSKLKEEVARREQVINDIYAAGTVERHAPKPDDSRSVEAVTAGGSISIFNDLKDTLSSFNKGVFSGNHRTLRFELDKPEIDSEKSRGSDSSFGSGL